MITKRHDYEISVFYFPNYHRGDRHNKLWHGEDWTEWELMKHATPRFEGHSMPKIPLWGYEDESDISVMEKKIRTAAEYGITNMLFDWYWYEDGIFLNKALDEGFLKCSNVQDIRFSIMWANHDWMDIHPLARAYKNCPRCELKWALTENSFFDAFSYITEKYFSRPNYFRLDGGLFFCIYEISKFIGNFGGLDGARRIIEKMREHVRRAGLGELHLNAIVWDMNILMGESKVSAAGDILKNIGVDSVTSYVWVHEHAVEQFPSMEYSEYRKKCENDFYTLSEKFRGLPYYPNVTVGWDSSPRTVQTDMYDNIGYPFSGVLENNTPQELEKALMAAKKALDGSTLQTKMLTVNAWNEWTEGSYLEPDTEYGYGRLEAIRKVFGRR